ncbi:MAG: hypothetical protein AB8H79_19545 [Myxococcota bacterium]
MDSHYQCACSNDSDSDSDSDSDTDVVDEKPCDPVNFGEPVAGELDWKWLGLVADKETPCPEAGSPWTGEKLFPWGSGELGRYCVYEKPAGGAPENCNLPYYEDAPPWEWLDRDIIGG